MSIGIEYWHRNILENTKSKSIHYEECPPFHKFKMYTSLLKTADLQAHDASHWLTVCRSAVDSQTDKVYVCFYNNK